jgi:phage gp36-like protein
MAQYRPFYTTFQELKQLYPKIDTISLTSANINELFIAKAEGEINAKLASRYTVPFSRDAVPLVIKSIAQDISLYFILRRLYTQNKKDKNPWLDEWKEAREMLDELAKGTMTLVDNSGAVIGQSTTQMKIWSNVTDFNPAMDHRDVTKQRIDPDRLEQEEDDDDSATFSSILD